jgi:hypothetical protein
MLEHMKHRHAIREEIRILKECDRFRANNANRLAAIAASGARFTCQLLVDLDPQQVPITHSLQLEK